MQIKDLLTEKISEKRAVSIGVFLLLPVFEFYVNQYAMTDDLHKMLCKLIITNILFYELLSLLLLFITGSGKRAARIVLVLSCFLGILNAYIYRFRGSYIRPWDFLSAGTALNVAANYNYTPDIRMLVSFAAAAILFIIAGFINIDFAGISRKALVRLCGAALSAALIILMAVTVRTDGGREALDIYTTQFDSKGMIRNNGMALTFMYQMKYLSVEKPEGYDRAEEENILAAYDRGEAFPDETPDILVFMDEAFSDPAVDGDFSTNMDYMPFIHSLQEGCENTITGYVNTSVNGGNTPNSEFEFLTGNTMAFLPQGSIAFQQYVRHEMASIPRYLKTYGYQTFASHPYRASGWDRPRVYPLLGFDEMYFEDYFNAFSPEKVRNYISDDAYFRLVSDKADEMSADGPVFSFNVTMQNHSAYSKESYDNFERSVSVNGIDEMSAEAVEMDNYLSLVRYTDEAFEKLIKRYEDADRPVMIVFFGDHQPDPATFDVMWDENGKDRDKLSDEDYADTYRVPFVIWANFDIDEMTGVETSLNYLGNLVLKEAGFDLPPYRNFLSELSEYYPVISAVRSVDAAGNFVMEPAGENGLNGYRKLQYFMMFDEYRTPDKEKYSFSYDWTKHGNIAHAMGATEDGIRNTNSREAFIYNYGKGFRIFEADLIYTRDNVLMCGHRWDDILGESLYEERGGSASSSKMTWDELKENGIQGKYTPLRLSDFILLLKDYPETYVVLDMKQTKPEQVREIYQEVYDTARQNAPEVLERLIPQIYNDKVLDAIMGIYPWKSCLYSCYKTKAERFPEYVVDYAKRNGIKVITVDHNKESAEWNKYLNDNGMTIYYNTINDEAEEEELKQRGVYGIYTDRLTG